MDDLSRRKIGEGLRETALNDIENCINTLLTNPFDETGWTNFNSSLQTAQTLGVPTESVLSKLLNSLPNPIKENVLKAVAKKHNLTDAQVEEIQAPED